MASSSSWAFPASKLLDPTPPPTLNEAMTTPPATDPLTASELRDFARIDGDSVSDTVCTAAIKAAVRFVERELGRAIIAQTWTATIEGEWPDGGLTLLRQPKLAISSIKTNRVAVADETWAAADWMLRPGGVLVALNSSLKTLDENEWIEVVYTVGHADAATFKAAEPNLHFALQIIAHERAIWDRDIGGDAPLGWPGASWDLAADYLVFRGVG